MSGEYTVLEAKNAGERDTQHGKLTKWYCVLENERGQSMPDVYWQRKEGAVVAIGDKIYGSVSQGDYGPRFRLEARDESGPQESAGQGSLPQDRSRQAADTGGGSLSKDDYWGAKEQRDLERDRRYIEAQPRIERQHSQEMAIRYLAALDHEDKTLEHVQKITNWFAADLEPLPTHSPTSKGHSSHDGAENGGGDVADAALPPAPTKEEVEALGLTDVTGEKSADDIPF